MFCSDDKHPDDLALGHINLTVKKAIALGHDLFDVLRCATLNPVEHYRLDVGLLRQGDAADFIVVSDLKDFNVIQTYVNGELVAENGAPLQEKHISEPLNVFRATKKQPSDFRIEAKGKRIRVIEAYNGELITGSIVCDAKIEGNAAVADVENDILKLTVVNRYADCAPAVAFIKGIGLKSGAFASSVAHDSHNIIAIGTNDDDLCAAVNAVIDSKGGMAVAENENIEILPLPYFGLMAGGDGYETGRMYSALDKRVKQLGSTLDAPFMTLSFMALLVIPSLKLSDKGLFDGGKFEFVGVWFPD
jgi:adenine deaminase